MDHDRLPKEFIEGEFVEELEAETKKTFVARGVNRKKCLEAHNEGNQAKKRMSYL